MEPMFQLRDVERRAVVRPVVIAQAPLREPGRKRTVQARRATGGHRYRRALEPPRVLAPRQASPLRFFARQCADEIALPVRRRSRLQPQSCRAHRPWEPERASHRLHGGGGGLRRNLPPARWAAVVVRQRQCLAGGVSALQPGP